MTYVILSYENIFVRQRLIFIVMFICSITWLQNLFHNHFYPNFPP